MSSQALSTCRSGAHAATVAAMIALQAALLQVAAVPAIAEPLPDPLAAGWNGKAVCEKLHEVEVPANYSWISDGVSWHEVLNIGETTSVYLIVEAL